MSNAEIEKAIEEHDAKKRKHWLIAFAIVGGIIALGFLALYGCACYMSPTGHC